MPCIEGAINTSTNHRRIVHAADPIGKVIATAVLVGRPASQPRIIRKIKTAKNGLLLDMDFLNHEGVKRH